MPRIDRIKPPARRTAPGDDSPEDELLGAEPEAADSEAAAKLPFFDYIESLTPGECERREVWIYRLNADGRAEALPGRAKKYLEICPLPLDSTGQPYLRQYISSRYGGGRYEIFLKCRVDGERSKRNEHHTATFDVDGPSKYPVDTPPTIDASTGQTVAGQPGAAPGAGLSDAVVLKLIDQRDASKPVGSEMVADAARKAVDMFTDIAGAALKKDAGSMSGNAIVDELIKKSLDRALNPPPPPPPPAPLAPVDPMEQLARSIDAAEKLRKMLAPETPAPVTRAPREPGLLSGVTLKDVVEVANSGHGDLVRDLLLGPREEPTGWGVVATIFGRMLEANPALPGALAEGAVTLLQRITTAAPRTLGQEIPVHGGREAALPVTSASQSQPVASGGGAVPSDTPPSPSQQEAMVNELLRMIRRAFETNSSGDDAAAGIDTFFPEAIPQLQQLFSAQTDEQILTWLRMQPVLAPVAHHPEWTGFFADFKASILAGFDGGETELPSQAEQQPAAV